MLSIREVEVEVWNQRCVVIEGSILLLLTWCRKRKFDGMKVYILNLFPLLDCPELSFFTAAPTITRKSTNQLRRGKH